MYVIANDSFTFYAGRHDWTEAIEGAKTFATPVAAKRKIDKLAEFGLEGLRVQPVSGIAPRKPKPTGGNGKPKGRGRGKAKATPDQPPEESA